MKIAIITFHRAINYGAVLQAWALQEQLKRMGHDVRILDYNSKQMKAYTKAFNMFGQNRSLKSYIKAAVYAPYRGYKISKFRKFVRKWLNVTSRLKQSDLCQMDKQFDLFITGSDQVWNDFLAGFDGAYFLDFVTKREKKASYSASFGFESVPVELVSEYKERLNSISKISVRENTGRNIVYDLLEREVPITVDPTLLLDMNSWMPMINVGSRKNFKKYILIYTLNPIKHLMNCAFDIAEKEDLAIYYISLDIKNLRDYRECNRLKHLLAPSPENFLDLLYNAEWVLTNSFHGTVFSIIFHKKFYSEVDYGFQKNDRIISLLESLGLNSQKISENRPTQTSYDIDWANVEKLLNNYRSQSLFFLEECFKDLENQ